MASVSNIQELVPKGAFSFTVALGAFSLLLLIFLLRKINTFSKSRHPKLPPVPEVRGRVPLVGNLLQLKEKKPYKTFTQWAEQYGPIYSVRTGAFTMVVLNTADVAKESFFSFFNLGPRAVFIFFNGCLYESFRCLCKWCIFYYFL